MTRRFAVTLLVVAIAEFSASAFALAPVIGYVKSPIIVDDTPNTSANLFVYPDAMDLNAMATDDNVPPSGIVWSYTDAGTGRYTINGRVAMDLGGGDNPNAPGNKALSSGAAADDSASVDSNLRTITFRDTTLSPVGGPNTDPTPNVVTTSIVHSEVLTLFASDGTTYSQKNFMVYSERKGSNVPAGTGFDRLSGAAVTVTSVLATSTPPATGSLGWSSSTLGVTMSATGGLCMNSPAAGQNFASWTSPYGIVPLVANMVYRFRIVLDDNAAAALPVGTTPLWDLVIDNYNPAAAENKYFGDFMDLDHFTTGLSPTSNPNSAGAANTAPKTFDVYWCPPPITAPDWNDGSTGEFSSAHAASKDLRLTFRVLDVDSGADSAQNNTGTLCLRTLTVDTIPLSSLTAHTTLYDVGPGDATTGLTASTNTVVPIFGIAPTAEARTTVTFSGGKLTVAPNTGGTYTDGTTGATAWNLEAISIYPAQGVLNIADPVSLAANFPFPWVSGQLLKGTVGVQAPNSQAASNPPDVIQLIWDGPTTELLETSAIAAATNNLGMPKTTESQLTSFFYTQTKTNSTIVNGDRLRLSAQLVLRPEILAGNLSTNTGGITFTQFRVDQMDLP